MTTLWMLYVLVLGTLLAAAAAAADAALRLAGRATRGVWAAAMAGTLALPALAWVAATRAATAPQLVGAAEGPRDGSAAIAALLARAEVRNADGAPALPWEALDRPLLLLWIVAATVGLAWLALSRRRLRALTRRWQPTTIAGERVLVAPDAGPAAVADQGGRIVLPTWALALGDHELALMLAHERAHLQARDPQLLTAATVAVALAPWNPALWWQLRRLRLAVEIDCDRRVLRRHPDVGAYGALLLDVARRGSPHGPRLAAALSAPTAATTLERRIRTMTSLRPRHAAARALGLTTLGVGLALAACETPHPTAVRPETRVPLQKITNAAPSVASVEGRPSIERVRAAIETAMPQVANGSAKAKRIWLVSDASGKVVKAAFDAGGESLVAKNAGDAYAGGPAWMNELDPKTIRSVDVLKLAAGRATPDSVGVIWITLRAAGASAAASGGEVRVVGRKIGAAADGGAERAVAVRSAAGAPLYVVDGVEQPAGPETERTIAAIAPDRIASVEVLKRAAAVAKYGARGEHGVVTITMKKPATREY